MTSFRLLWPLFRMTAPFECLCLCVDGHVCIYQVAFYAVDLHKVIFLKHRIFVDKTGDDEDTNKRPTAWEKTKTANNVKVPKIYWDLTRSAVLTMEWVDGIKLTDEISLKKACLNRRDLIDQVLIRNCSLTLCSSSS